MADGKANVLHFAVASGEADVVKWLVHRGVNKEQKDKGGRLPADIAKMKGYKDIQAFLKEKVTIKPNDVSTACNTYSPLPRVSSP